MFIQSRLKELAELMRNEIQFSTDPTVVATQAKSHPESLIILDLEASEYDSSDLARAVKQITHPPRILAYFPHIRRDLEKNARDAGIDYVVPNSAFLKTVKQVLEGSASSS